MRFRMLGGLPPPTHEDLRVGPDGDAWYVTGMPWPDQPPFDEIGAYRTTVDASVAEALTGAARAVLAVTPPHGGGSPDLGIEWAGVDGSEGYWSPDARPAGASALVEQARAVIGPAREHPWAVVRGQVGEDGVTLTNRGGHSLELRDGELRAGWGTTGDPPTPLDLAPRPPQAVALPEALTAGGALTLALPDPGPATGEAVHALVHLSFRSPVDDDWIDGWLVAGPGP